MTTDSVKHNEKRSAEMRASAKANQAVVDTEEQRVEVHQKSREQLAREREIEFLEVQVGLVREGETRDMLLNRIRRMRELTVEPEPRYIGMNPALEAQTKREQEAGRAVVAMREAELETNRELWRKQEEEERAKKREVELVSVHHPNPTQEEQFPATNATLGKRK